MKFHHPLQGHAPLGLSIFIYFSLLCGLVALPISIANAIDSRTVAAQASEDRVAADLASCERGNDIRARQIETIESTSAGFAVAEASLAGILGNAATVQLHAALGPVLADLATARAGIHLIDCRALVPGAK